MGNIPKKLQSVLWSASTENLDLNKDKAYIIHQVLMYGDLADIRWLFKTYPKEEIKRVFLEKPQKVYTKKALNFIKNFVLDLKEERVASDKYVNTLY